MKNNHKQSKEQFINIPYSIMRREDLSQTQKIIYGFINGFNKPEICYASNKYIADVIGLKETAVSKAISILVVKDMVKAYNPKGRSRSLVVQDNNLVVEEDNLVVSDILTLSSATNNNIVYNINNNIEDNIEKKSYEHEVFSSSKNGGGYKLSSDGVTWEPLDEYTGELEF